MHNEKYNVHINNHNDEIDIKRYFLHKNLNILLIYLFYYLSFLKLIHLLYIHYFLIFVLYFEQTHHNVYISLMDTYSILIIFFSYTLSLLLTYDISHITKPCFHTSKFFISTFKVIYKA